MPHKLQASAPGFSEALTAILLQKREMSEEVDSTVREILQAVRQNGDAAVADFTKRFDRVSLPADRLRLSQDAINDALAAADPQAVAALKIAARRIAAYHERQLPAGDLYRDAAGFDLGHRWTAIGAVGLYVPGGLAAYPSSVLMNAIPAKVAGVPRVAMVVPHPDGQVNPLVLAAANIAGVHEIYAIGGAQAVAALAYGTEAVGAVDKIVGPGNAYVAAAKRQVFGTVGIDMIAGPSEILVVADNSTRPAWVAADLLSQAEHDTGAQSILITDSADLIAETERAVAAQLVKLSRRDIAEASWRDFGVIIQVDDLMTDAPALIDRFAPEHLQLAIADPEAMLPRFSNAGAIFLGDHAPEVIGDYVAGPNHVLPTARSARYASGLSVLDFMKRSSIIRGNTAALREVADTAITLAEAEGLDAHAYAVAIRLEQS